MGANKCKLGMSYAHENASMHARAYACMSQIFKHPCDGRDATRRRGEKRGNGGKGDRGMKGQKDLREVDFALGICVQFGVSSSLSLGSVAAHHIYHSACFRGLNSNELGYRRQQMAKMRRDSTPTLPSVPHAREESILHAHIRTSTWSRAHSHTQTHAHTHTHTFTSGQNTHAPMGSRILLCTTRAMPSPCFNPFFQFPRYIVPSFDTRFPIPLNWSLRH